MTETPDPTFCAIPKQVALCVTVYTSQVGGMHSWKPALGKSEQKAPKIFSKSNEKVETRCCLQILWQSSPVLMVYEGLQSGVASEFASLIWLLTWVPLEIGAADGVAIG